MTLKPSSDLLSKMHFGISDWLTLNSSLDVALNESDLHLRIFRFALNLALKGLIYRLSNQQCCKKMINYWNCGNCEKKGRKLIHGRDFFRPPFESDPRGFGFRKQKRAQPLKVSMASLALTAKPSSRVAHARNDSSSISLFLLHFRTILVSVSPQLFLLFSLKKTPFDLSIKWNWKITVNSCKTNLRSRLDWPWTFKVIDFIIIGREVNFLKPY